MGVHEARAPIRWPVRYDQEKLSDLGQRLGHAYQVAIPGYPPVGALGLLAAFASGLLGGIVPALRAVRIPLVDAIGGKA